MKIIKCALCAIAGVIAFSACSKVENSITEGTRSLRISINNDVTKADDDPVTGSVKSDYSSLYIYFTDGTNVVSSDIITTAADIASFKATGKSYDNISSSITKVLIVANVKGADALPTSAGTTVASIKSFAFGIASQQPDAVNYPENTKTGKLQVTMLGESTLTEDIGSSPNADGNKVMKAAVTLTPVVARVEISKALTTGDGVFSIQIDHVYLNTYYSDYSFAQNALVNKATDIAAYTDNLQNNAYSADVISGTKADAYHVFANGTSTVMPHIILKVSGNFKDATDAQGAAFSDKYLTITKFSDTSTTNPIATLDPNRIYKIDLSKLTVPASVLDPTPEAGRISLSVSVDVAEWTVVNVTPEL